jgi:hypothetical protein
MKANEARQGKAGNEQRTSYKQRNKGNNVLFL